MEFLPRTTDVLDKARYFATPQDFFGSLGVAYDAVRSQILKFERLQEYDESGNASFDAFKAGDTSRAVDLIHQSKVGDKPFYESFELKKIDFIRVRPVKIPRTAYLDWEIENYKISAGMGEQIYFFHYEQLSEVIEKHALHDFMIFDARFAFVHDYDARGKLQGGWRVENPADIYLLICLFGFMRANATNFLLTLR